MTSRSRICGQNNSQKHVFCCLYKFITFLCIYV